MLKQKLVSRILQAVFPLLVAEPPPGEQDPEDQDDNDYDMENNNPKNSAAQVDLLKKNPNYFISIRGVLIEP